VSTTEKVCTKLIAEGWKQVKSKKKTGYEGFIERVKSLSENEFIVDFHLDFLLVFPSSAQFHNHDFLRNGSILLQDKVCLNQLKLFGVIILLEFSRQVVCQQWHYRPNHFTAR
jgi:putative methyltransferase